MIKVYQGRFFAFTLYCPNGYYYYQFHTWKGIFGRTIKISIGWILLYIYLWRHK